jgi:DNA (cytosine-5)-methyltransferase 1
MRNALIREMHRLTEEVRPDAVMLENVPRLAMDGYGGPLYEEFLDGLEELGYYVPEASRQVLQMADYGVPQNRRRLVVLAGRGFAIELPAPTHSRDGLNGLPKWKTLRHAIPENLGSPVGLKASRKHGGPRACNWHVVRDITERNRKRLASASPGGDRRDIPTELRPACHKDDDYDGFTNVYGRMAWDETPVTITTGCATPSRGRFGHPEEVRTISIREAALIQTFPPDYVIDTPYVKYATKIVGNALPCHFARLVSEQCHEAILQNVEDPHGPLPDGA